jgi:uncharacterized tellurite resistance protein B-like protein
MGLFDKLRGNAEINLSPRGAMLLACISMVGADGHIDEDEAAITYRIDGEQHTRAWYQALDAWRRVSTAADCVELVAARLDTEQRRFTLANLVDIAMADGFLEGTEKALLEICVEAFGTDPLFVDAVCEVIGTKNNRSLFAQ